MKKGITYGDELIKSLESEIELCRNAISNRINHVLECDFDWDDCFVSQRFEERAIHENERKIQLIKDGGCAWFIEYSTLENQLVNARWVNTKYGLTLRAEMPDGSIVWTSATTEKGLAHKGLKTVRCKRPAWFRFNANGGGMLGAYTGSYVLCPSDINYATGEAASDYPLQVEWDIE